MNAPLYLNPEEMEICLAILGYLIFLKTDKEMDFPSFLSEFLDDIFHYAGILEEEPESEDDDEQITEQEASD